MFKRLLNECVIDLTLRPEGALLIKSGLAQMSGVDMAWVKVPRNGGWEVYLPGSSLKGTIRSHAERIARTLNESAACNPLGGRRDKLRSCGSALDVMNRDKKETELTTPLVYQHSCPICRLFGNTWIMGRLATEDAYVMGDAPALQHRDGVGIDRFTGGASRGAKFELEVITGGEFKTALHLQNFELWQLGLLGFVLQDLREGLVRMGSGKSRGLGKVVAQIDKITLHYIGARKKMLEDDHLNLMGVGALFEQAKDYGMASDDQVRLEKAAAVKEESAFSELRQTVSFSFDAFPWQAVAAKWVNYVQTLPSDPLKQYRSGR
ncbi:MAG: CRISPR-associated RAMP protein [Calditrichaceae bacterium]|nr:CRISPR-associated RAMP protein Csx7 [Calditrichia bacterium]NUQ43077.1 CRISPR-associated RAMP protein [Calditrichaceae bacterium]